MVEREMKSKHDLGCGARDNRECDCEQGRLRKIKQHAVKQIKRQRKKISVRTGIPYEDTLEDLSKG